MRELGADRMEPHELLEAYLFSALPRVNTNPIAHELLRKFGSLSGVLDADISELCTVNGMGMAAAEHIKLLSAMMRACSMEEFDGKQKFDSLRKAGEFGISLFRGVTVECAYALLLDNAMRKLDCIKLSEGSVNSTVPDLRLLYKEILNRNASAVILYHNHYKGLSVPSGNDVRFTHELETSLAQISTMLIEHIVVAENNFTPIMQSQKGSYRPYIKGGISMEIMDRFYL